MDIIINSKFFDLPKYMQISFKDKLINHFGITQHKTIGETLHTLYEGLQIDYFKVKESNLQTLTNYMDFGVGNFIGKIARKFNLKYGMDGLSYVYRSSDNYYKNELLISTDLEKIFKLFDLDYSKWKQGFIDKKDAFDWIISSKFFSTYTYYNQKSGTKKREKNRQEFKDFITYLKDNNIDKDIIFPSEEAIFDTIREVFPSVDIVSFINENSFKYKNILRIKEKFNANVINEIYPNLKGKDLGNFIFKFKEYINHNYGDFNNYIINIPKYNIDKLIIQYYQNHFKK